MVCAAGGDRDIHCLICCDFFNVHLLSLCQLLTSLVNTFKVEQDIVCSVKCSNLCRPQQMYLPSVVTGVNRIWTTVVEE